jgi:2-polyprenyl-3-methyl-5-hydroxy-6-metoxy-1,4-benzoquinol methylase
MKPGPTNVRGGEYAVRGDYHRAPDPSWDYYPTYLAKLAMVRDYLDALPPATRVLDAGCGEGVLVEEYASRLAIEGVDDNYQSAHVARASILDLPAADARYDRALCLDVLEHLAYADQSKALAELFRVLAPGGELLVTVPNLAHLQSRVRFLAVGRLMRTASPLKHPGDRPYGEYLELARQAGFELVSHRGIFPTVPGLTHAIRTHPARLAWLHRLLTRLLPVPGWCFLSVFRLRKPWNRLTR